MHWHDYLATLHPTEAQRLLNRFTVGCGWLALAARRLGNDGAVTEVLGAVIRAADALRLVRARLAAPVDANLVWTEPHPQATDSRARHWRDLILRSDHILAARLIADLTDAVAASREAGCCALADGEVATIDGLLEQSLAILARAARALERVVAEADR